MWAQVCQNKYSIDWKKYNSDRTISPLDRALLRLPSKLIRSISQKSVSPRLSSFCSLILFSQRNLRLIKQIFYLIQIMSSIYPK